MLIVQLRNRLEYHLKKLGLFTVLNGGNKVDVSIPFRQIWPKLVIFPLKHKVKVVWETLKQCIIIIIITYYFQFVSTSPLNIFS